MEGEIKIDIDRELLACRLREKLIQESPLSGHSCIFKVPSSLRRHNEHLFEPSLVSIGPYHHGNEKLQGTQRTKFWYLRCLLERKPTPRTTLECLIESVKCNLHCLKSYVEAVAFGTEELVEMMVVDGCFIIEYFRKYARKVQPRVDDPLFNMSWTRKALVFDLLLLENQLPWFVLDCLYKLTTNPEEEQLPLPQLAHNCPRTDTLRFERIQVDPGLTIKHLLDLQRSIILYSDDNKNDDQDQDDGNYDNNENKGRGKKGVPLRKGWIATPCVTELLKAGVKFEPGNKTNLMKIEFRKGVLIIPPIQVLDNAESLFRNLIAYEQCDRSLEDKITSYAGILDNLIKSSADLDYLRRKKIITCYLSTEDVSGFFQRLYNDAHVVRYSYAEVSYKINDYCQKRVHRWLVILVRDYFANPWTILSLGASTVILALTFFRAFYGIH